MEKKLSYKLFEQFSNLQLRGDMPRLLESEEMEIKKDNYHNGEENVWVIDINDTDSYVYYMKSERDEEYGRLNKFMTQYYKAAK